MSHLESGHWHVYLKFLHVPIFSSWLCGLHILRFKTVACFTCQNIHKKTVILAVSWYSDNFRWYKLIHWTSILHVQHEIFDWLNPTAWVIVWMCCQWLKTLSCKALCFLYHRITKTILFFHEFFKALKQS